MAEEGVHAAACPHVPDLDGVVEAAGDDAVALRVEVQRHDLRRVAQQGVQALARLHVPQPRGVVHGSGGQHGALRVEGQTDYLRRVAPVRMIQLPRLSTPQLASFIFTRSKKTISNWNPKR